MAKDPLDAEIESVLSLPDIHAEVTRQSPDAPVIHPIAAWRVGEGYDCDLGSLGEPAYNAASPGELPPRNIVSAVALRQMPTFGYGTTALQGWPHATFSRGVGSDYAEYLYVSFKDAVARYKLHAAMWSDVHPSTSVLYGAFLIGELEADW